MAYRMKPAPVSTHAEPDGDEVADGVGDITKSPDSTTEDMSYIKDFVGALSETELAYLRDCIAEHDNAKDRPEYRSEEQVKTEQESDNATSGRTRNDEDGDELA